MALIPIGMSYTTSMKGQTPKVVVCEKCGMEYVYILEATGTADQFSPLFLDREGARRHSAEQAQAALQKNLQEGCEPVPCPECGTVQQHMYSKARELRFKSMRYWGLGALAAGAVLVFVGIQVAWDGASFALNAFTVLLGIAAGAAILAGFVILERRQWQYMRYDPNASPAEARKMYGRMFATSKEDFLRNAEKPGAANPGISGPALLPHPQADDQEQNRNA